MHPDPFLTETLRTHPASGEVTAILAAALAAVDPAAAVRTHFYREGQTLFAGGQQYDLRDFENVTILGAGKAAAPMALAAAGVLGSDLAGGAIVTKDGHSDPALAGSRIEQFEAGHPLPDERGVRAARRILDLARDAGPRGLVICLISGGGSALLSAPVPQIGLRGLAALTERLLASGADIHEFNTVRKHLSLVKGGQLAKAAIPARVITLILSDVVGDDLEVIASGPTVPDRSTFQEAAAVLQKYGQTIPGYILDGLAGRVPETPKPGDPLFKRVSNLLVGTNRLAAEAALARARSGGFSARLLTGRLTGEARDAGVWLARQLAGMPARACWVAGGETTVTLGPDPGFGGRNLETALAAVPGVAGLEQRLLITLATDGGDGPTDAAGAVVSGETHARAIEQNLDPHAFLRRHDAYAFFEPLGDLIKTGPTRTNVNDLSFLFNLAAPGGI